MPATTATVPDVTGLAREAAVGQLDAAGFNAAVTEVESLEPARIVVRQIPAGGSTADLGITVRLEVSNGKPPRTTVPNVIGMSEDAARSAIEDAGFVVDVAFQQVEDKDKDGTVLRQDPPGDTPAAEGSSVRIVVGRRGG